MVLLTVRVGMSLTLLPALGVIFFLFSCLVQPEYEEFLFVLLYLVISYLVDVFWRGNRSGREGRKETWRSEDRKNCGWVVLHERRIFSLKRERYYIE